MNDIDQVPGIFDVKIADFDYISQSGNSNTIRNQRVLCKSLDRGYLLVLVESNPGNFEIRYYRLDKISNFKFHD